MAPAPPYLMPENASHYYLIRDACLSFYLPVYRQVNSLNTYKEGCFMTNYKYFELSADFEGIPEILFGSYVESEVKEEKKEEGPCLRDQGYTNLRVIYRFTSEAPSSEVYPLHDGYYLTTDKDGIKTLKSTEGF